MLLTGEPQAVLRAQHTFEQPMTFILVLFTGVVSFGLNITSFYVNKVTSALTLTVVGNVKQAAVIFLSMFLFSEPVSVTKIAGILTTTMGGYYYSKVASAEGKKG
jgi:hypothetical protein